MSLKGLESRHSYDLWVPYRAEPVESKVTMQTATGAQSRLNLDEELDAYPIAALVTEWFHT